jgi:uncharacterized protein YjbJ (UPF0337 family)
MNRDVFEGKWKQLRGVVKEKWGKLTDDELDTIEGRLDRFAGLLQERYGYARDRAVAEIESWMQNQSPKNKGPFSAWILLALVPALGLAGACKPRDTASTQEIRSKLSAQVTAAERNTNAPDANSERDWIVGKQTADSVITLAVKNRLSQDPDVKGLRIALHTKKGIVYLSGIVQSVAVRDRAVQLARETESVRGVHANFTVMG